MGDSEPQTLADWLRWIPAADYEDEDVSAILAAKVELTTLADTLDAARAAVRERTPASLNGLAVLLDTVDALVCRRSGSD